MNNEENPCIIIVDDEIIALNHLTSTITAILEQDQILKNITVLSTYSPTKALELIKEKKPILAFLDIQMPRLNGLELAQKISYSKEYKQNIPAIVFVTAYEEYGYDAFQVEALDYVLKPYNQEAITKTLNKFKTQYSFLLKNINTFIIINHNGIDIKIYESDIIYLKADTKYITIKTKDKEFLANDTILNLEDRFPNFLKIHRSYLINPYYLHRVYKKDNSWNIQLVDNIGTLTISRRQWHEIKDKLPIKELQNNQ